MLQPTSHCIRREISIVIQIQNEPTARSVKTSVERLNRAIQTPLYKHRISLLRKPFTRTVSRSTVTYNDLILHARTSPMDRPHTFLEVSKAIVRTENDRNFNRVLFDIREQRMNELRKRHRRR